jgi:acyl-homoserine-lactone acylase
LPWPPSWPPVPAATDPAPEYSATIRTTSYGVPHVVADNFKGAGFGYGYAFAQQNVCLYAEELVTLRGERAQYFGATGGYLGQLGTISGNVDSDFFYKLLMTKAQAERIKAESSQSARDIVTGFAAGYNRYLSDTGAANLPAECRGADWVKPMSEDEAYLRLTQAAIAGSSLNFINSIGNAQPPASTPVGALKSTGSPRSCPVPRQLAAITDGRGPAEPAGPHHRLQRLWPGQGRHAEWQGHRDGQPALPLVGRVAPAPDPSHGAERESTT